MRTLFFLAFLPTQHPHYAAGEADRIQNGMAL